MNGSSQRGFTLVELLTVVALVALLLAILLPSLAKSKEQTRQVVCMAHMKQVGHVASLYANDNDGIVFRVANATGNWPHEFRNRSSGDPGNPALGLHRNRQGKLQGYLPDGKVFFCPSVTRVSYKNNYNPYPVNFLRTMWGTFSWIHESFYKPLREKRLMMVDAPSQWWKKQQSIGHIAYLVFAGHINQLHDDGSANPTGVDVKDNNAVDLWFHIDFSRFY